MPTSASSKRTIDAETTPLRDPEHYQYDFNLRGHRRSLAARQRHRVVAAGPDGGRPGEGSRACRIRRPRLRFGRRPLDDQSRHRRSRAGRRFSPPRSTNASARAAKPTIRTSCCRRCATNSADIWKNPPKSGRLERTAIMNESHSDALVFFGATGDLAYKKIFPALQAMVKRGHLDVPVIGVAKAGWNLDQLRARAQDSLEKHGGIDRQRLRQALRACCATSMATTTTPRLSEHSAKNSAPHSTQHTISPSRRSCSARSSNNWQVRLRQWRARHRRKAFRTRSRLRAGA